MIAPFNCVDLEKLDSSLNFIHDTNTNDISKLSEIMSKYNSDKGYGLSKDFINNNGKPPNYVCHNYTFIYSQLFY